MRAGERISSGRTGADTSAPAAVPLFASGGPHLLTYASGVNLTEQLQMRVSASTPTLYVETLSQRRSGYPDILLLLYPRMHRMHGVYTRTNYQASPERDR